jgi:dihydroorotate dehydrogenase (fumarate)
MDTNYLGLKLKNPLIASASSISSHLDQCKELEDHGIAAIVMHSLFEEEINYELNEIDHMLFNGKDSFAEALDFFPENNFENYESDNYLSELQQLKSSLDIPIIASLNGVSSGGWVKYAKILEDAGADALELNLHYPADSVNENTQAIEARYLHSIAEVKLNCNLKLAVKLSPYFTALPNFLELVHHKGASAAVLFNRFYQPDIDLEALEWRSKLYQSSSVDFAKALRAVAINYKQSGLDLSISGGVSSGEDIIKAVMAGASTVGVATALYERGLAHASVMLKEAETWMIEKEYDSFDQMRGAISYLKSPNPAALERANYVNLLRQSEGI